MDADFLPIDPILVQKSGDIRVKLAELSYLDINKTIELLRIWGERRMPITSFYDLLVQTLEDEKKRPTALQSQGA